MAGRLQFTKDEAQAAATIPNKQKALQKKQMLTRPAASAVHAAEVSAHVEISQYEQDNVGVEAANRGAETAEVGVRVIDRHAEQKKLTRKKQSEALSEDGPKKKGNAQDNSRPNRQPGRRDGRPQRESGSVRSENQREGRQSALRHAHEDGDHSGSRRDSFHEGDAKHQNHAHEGRGSARSAPRQQSASSVSRSNAAKKQSTKLQQKRGIKKEYAAAKRNGKSATESFSTVTSRIKESLSETGKKAVQFVKKHKGGAIIGIGLFMVVAIGINLMGGGAALSSGTTAVVDATTYPSADEDILAAEEQYLGMEAELQSRIDNYESTHSYDEYHYELDEIFHDPYVLISMLTAIHNGDAWTISYVQPDLEMLFEMQYTLSESVVTEIRTRTVEREVEDPDTGEVTTEEVEEEYEYTICTVTLHNENLSHVPILLFSENQLSLYSMYMSTLGNRPDLWPESGYVNLYLNGDEPTYELSVEALSDETFATMMEEATKYLGYPYVWGGASPATSFDCSGFVSWVINHCGVGWDYGRLGAQGLCNICTRVSTPKPGDLVFFVGTYDTTGVSHVGIYVGDNMMLHCGDPIQYSDLSSSYWQEHFYCYGRLPNP